jgi:hypothetical protein
VTLTAFFGRFPSFTVTVTAVASLPDPPVTASPFFAAGAAVAATRPTNASISSARASRPSMDREETTIPPA